MCLHQTTRRWFRRLGRSRIHQSLQPPEEAGRGGDIPGAFNAKWIHLSCHVAHRSALPPCLGEARQKFYRWCRWCRNRCRWWQFRRFVKDFVERQICRSSLWRASFCSCLCNPLESSNKEITKVSLFTRQASVKPIWPKPPIPCQSLAGGDCDFATFPKSVQAGVCCHHDGLMCWEPWIGKLRHGVVRPV